MRHRQTLFKIEIPFALPGIITGFYLAMMAAFADFGTPYIIPLDLQVLPVLIQKEYMSEVGANMSIASTGSILMILVSSLILMGQRIYLASRSSYALVKSRKPSAMIPSGIKRLFIHGLTGVVLFFAIFKIPVNINRKFTRCDIQSLNSYILSSLLAFPPRIKAF